MTNYNTEASFNLSASREDLNIFNEIVSFIEEEEPGLDLDRADFLSSFSEHMQSRSIAVRPLDQAQEDVLMKAAQKYVDFGLNIDVTIVDEEPSAHIHGYDLGIETTAYVLQFWMMITGQTGGVAFSWAHTASRPVRDAFGGGAVAITAKEVKFFYPEDDAKVWLAKNAAA